MVQVALLLSDPRTAQSEFFCVTYTSLLFPRVDTDRQKWFSSKGNYRHTTSYTQLAHRSCCACILNKNAYYWLPVGMYMFLDCALSDMTYRPNISHVAANERDSSTE